MIPARILAAIVTAACLCLAAPRGDCGIIIGRDGTADYAPQVRLIAPYGETVDLTGKDSLLFRWSWIEGNRMERDYYDFRIYRGYDMLESTLIYAAHVAPDADRVSISAGLFRDGEVYTWSVRQRYRGLARSRRSYASFRVIKK